MQRKRYRRDCAGRGSGPAWRKPFRPSHADLWQADGTLAAIESKTLEAVRPLLEARANPNEKGVYTNGRPGTEQPPLSTLLASNNKFSESYTNIAKLLVEHRAHLDARLGGGRTALMKEAAKCDEPRVRLLLQLRADPTAKDDEHRTPLAYAQEAARRSSDVRDWQGCKNATSLNVMQELLRHP